MRVSSVIVLKRGAVGEEAMERPAMDTRREGRHCSRVKMAFQEGAVIAESR